MYQDQRARSLGEEEEPLIPLPFQVGEVTEKEPLIPQPVQVGEITEEELKQYNGSDPQKLLLLAIKHQIYAVTESRMFYGPGAPYALFAGIDISRALAKMSFEEKDLTWDISGLGPFELEALQDWEYKFMSKYAKVGTVKVTGLDASNRDPLVARPETTVVEKNDEAPAESDVKKG